MTLRYFRNTSKDIVKEKNLDRDRRTFLRLVKKTGLDIKMAKIRDDWDIPPEGIFEERNIKVWMQGMFFHEGNAQQFFLRMISELKEVNLPLRLHVYMADYTLSNFRFETFSKNEKYISCTLENPEDESVSPYPFINLKIHTGNLTEIRGFLGDNQDLIKEMLQDQDTGIYSDKPGDVANLQRDTLIRTFRNMTLKELNILAKQSQYGDYSRKNDAIIDIMKNRYDIEVSESVIAGIRK